MSLMVFDDSKIDEIKKRNEQGSQEKFDVVSASKEGKKWEWDPAKGIFRLIFKTTQ